jgi:hypothetical protein
MLMQEEQARFGRHGDGLLGGDAVPGVEDGFAPDAAVCDRGEVEKQGPCRLCRDLAAVLGRHRDIVGVIIF